MRKLISFMAMLCLAVLVFSSAALAAEPYELLPVDIIYSYDRMEIRKVYEMATSVDPGTIPRADFERDGILYKCTDIVREVVIGDETQTYIETETVESAKNDLPTILGLLEPKREVFTEDGYFGILYLSTSSIKTEVSGYGSSTSNVSITRSYPNLSDADSQYIPKSVTDGGITYTLSDIQWQTDNTYNVDDYEIGNRFTAIATYGGKKTSSYVKGYKVTADYVGEICRTGVSVIKYTVIFTGAAIETKTPEPTQTPEQTEPPIITTDPGATEPGITTTPAPNSEKSSGFNWMIVVIPLALLAAASTAGVAYLFLNKRKELKNHEETVDYDYTGVDSDDSDGDPGDGGGL